MPRNNYSFRYVWHVSSVFRRYSGTEGVEVDFLEKQKRTCPMTLSNERVFLSKDDSSRQDLSSDGTYGIMSTAVFLVYSPMIPVSPPLSPTSRTGSQTSSPGDN